MSRRIEVAGAVIIDQGRVFCTQRGPGNLEGYWEFPGGKLEQHETAQEALAREIREELGCTVTVGSKIATTEYPYDFALIALTTFYCSLAEGTPTLTEHIDSTWLAPNELATLEWAPADVPTVEQIQRDYK